MGHCLRKKKKSMYQLFLLWGRILQYKLLPRSSKNGLPTYALTSRNCPKAPQLITFFSCPFQWPPGVGGTTGNQTEKAWPVKSPRGSAGWVKQRAGSLLQMAYICNTDQCLAPQFNAVRLELRGKALVALWKVTPVPKIKFSVPRALLEPAGPFCVLCACVVKHEHVLLAKRYVWAWLLAPGC
jgi:hypothetical protein